MKKSTSASRSTSTVWNIDKWRMLCRTCGTIAVLSSSGAERRCGPPLTDPPLTTTRHCISTVLQHPPVAMATVASPSQRATSRYDLTSFDLDGPVFCLCPDSFSPFQLSQISPTLHTVFLLLLTWRKKMTEGALL
ncbi:Hypothetical protein NTJ_07357 [Nesidiocoris tenuis]|uniref:Uncharacterized protein n=1 Tax=Nesidiocoris tenuis TaxID=355587 RepID=A0ABN7AT84_9HEMI|nr:Hypothetical protein NTJ_07357 [Nesidiocoris tenuis]